jgi:sugar phosphate isomerase/epimerase
MSVQLALTPDGRWDADTDTLVGAAADAGFAAVGLSAARADRAAADSLRAHGIRCHEVLAQMISGNEAATLKSAQKLVEAADAVRADWVLANFTKPLTPEIRALIARCAAMYAEVGARMAVEFSPLGSVTSIAGALEVVEAAGADRAAVMIDTWHFLRGDSTWEQLERIPLEQIAYVQFDDALPAESEDGMAETMNRRVFPGDGEFDLERFAGTLRSRDWEGIVSIEVLSSELVTLPVPEFATRAYRSSAAYWL